MIAWFCRWVFRMIGWKLDGTYPRDVDKMLILVAPHTSSTDLWLGLLPNFGIPIHAHFYGKQELFRGIQGWFLKKLGGIPVDRSGHKDTVSVMIADVKSADRRIVVITPEGTRKKVMHFKTGFYYLAVGADIPILPTIFDYQSKKIRFKDLVYPTGDAEKDIPEIEALFRGYVGKNKELSF